MPADIDSSIGVLVVLPQENAIAVRKVDEEEARNRPERPKTLGRIIRTRLEEVKTPDGALSARLRQTPKCLEKSRRDPHPHHR
jgi:hypothetical protein